MHFLPSSKYKCSIPNSLNLWLIHIQLFCQHMVCDKPHSPVLHPCESDSINFRETQLKFFYADALAPVVQALGWYAIVWKSCFFPSSSFTWFCFYCQLELLHNPKYLWKFKLKYLSLQVGKVKIYNKFAVVVRFRFFCRYDNLCIFNGN